MNQNLENIIELAQTQGASQSEVYQVASVSHPVVFEANRLKQLENSQAEGTALRLWYEGRPGVAVAYGQFDPETLVKRAISLSQFNSLDSAHLTPARTQIVDEQESSTATETFIELGKAAIAKIRTRYPEAICEAEFDCETERTTLINSQGLHCEYTETSLSYYLGVELVKGEDFLGVYDGETSRKSLNCDRAVIDILQRLDWAQTNTPSPTGKVPVLLTANAATLLWDTVASALSGKRVREKSSPWSELLGEAVANPQVTILQQPHIAPYDCPFDDEGTPTQQLSLIEQGKVNSFYCDRSLAAELGIAPTGNGFRSDLGSYPTASLVNLIISPGKLGFSELIHRLDNGIIVDQLLGGGADISGDFSVNVELGYKVTNGKVVGRIKDTAISGNVYQILKEAVTFGNDSLWNGSCHTPSMIVEGCSVTR